MTKDQEIASTLIASVVDLTVDYKQTLPEHQELISCLIEGLLLEKKLFNKDWSKTFHKLPKNVLNVLVRQVVALYSNNRG